MNTAEENKDRLRSTLRKARIAITPEKKEDLEKAICEKLLYVIQCTFKKHSYNSLKLNNRIESEDNSKTTKIIGAYQAVGSEVSLDKFITHANCANNKFTIAFPVVHNRGKMTFCKISQSTMPSFFADATKPFPKSAIPKNTAIELHNLDVLVVPGVGFDKHCNRLGQGGGYYDRAIPKLRKNCLVIGVAFDEQICEKIPCSTLDQKVDCVITPTDTIMPTCTIQ